VTTDALTRVFEEGQRRRSDRAMTAFRTLRRFERRIAKEAAVMGYVLGYRSGNLDGRSGIGSPLDKNNPIPPDFEVLQRVIEHCDSTSDLYPFLAAACNGRRRRITKAWLFDFERAEVTP
jgi:hypothetical protein